MSLSSTLEQDAIDTREAELFGKPPRIAPLTDDQLGAEGSAVVAKVREILGIASSGDVPEFIRITLHHPELFKAQMGVGSQVVGPGATIPRREAEIAILRLGWLVRAPYEWGEHVAVAKMFGVTDEDIDRIVIGSSESGWSDHDRAILRGVEELLGDTYIGDETWDALAATWSEAQLLEFPVLVGVYLTTAMQQNSVRLRLSADNPGLSRR